MHSFFSEMQVRPASLILQQPTNDKLGDDLFGIACRGVGVLEMPTQGRGRSRRPTVFCVRAARQLFISAHSLAIWVASRFNRDFIAALRKTHLGGIFRGPRQERQQAAMLSQGGVRHNSDALGAMAASMGGTERRSVLDVPKEKRRQHWRSQTSFRRQPN